jgi:hypothetical protein
MLRAGRVRGTIPLAPRATPPARRAFHHVRTAQEPMSHTSSVGAARVAIRILVLALAMMTGSAVHAPLAAQDPACEPPPRRVAPVISTRPKRAAARPRPRVQPARPAVARAKPAVRPRTVRRRKVASRSAVPLASSATMSGAATRGCPAVAPVGPRVALVARADVPPAGPIGLIAELPALLPGAIVEDDSTGILPIWWLGAAGLAGGGAPVAVALPELILRGRGRTTNAPAPKIPSEVSPLPFDPVTEPGEDDVPPSGESGGASTPGPSTPPNDPPGAPAPSGPGAPPAEPRGPPPELPHPPIVGGTSPFPFPPGPEEEQPEGTRERATIVPPGEEPPGWDHPPTLTETTSVVPEPAPLALLLIGSGVLSLVLWKVSRRP